MVIYSQITLQSKGESKGKKKLKQLVSSLIITTSTKDLTVVTMEIIRSFKG